MTSTHSVPTARIAGQHPVARFEAVRLADGWTVVDLLDESAIVPMRPWDEDTATTMAGLLDEAPAYAVKFRWSEPPHGPAVANGSGDTSHLCGFCWQPAAHGAWVELRLYDGPGLKIGELCLMACADHLAALRPAYERELVECRVTRWERGNDDYPPGVLYRRPEERP